MATFPTINFAQFRWEVLDQNYLDKWNGMQDALVTMQGNIDTFGVEMNSAKDTATQAAADAGSYRDEAKQYRDQAQQIAVGDVAITDLQPAAWQPIDTDTVLAANDWYAVDFTVGPLTLTLPASPAANDMIRLYKSAGETKGSLIARNGETIGGLAEDMTLDREITGLEMVFTGADWRVVR